ncbi:hypothetical protein POVWA2_075660 [Plasmodium ovale wallikeri]|uniref:Uncharacterized protein n=1 Tax=Plasmodium ovale wallikeri TaxID=864142 RepID=A0A1A9AKV1_PLAOA|nr:hypothetical protein POVWA2_075660 [Plasmodium ovale wallikeri]
MPLHRWNGNTSKEKMVPPLSKLLKRYFFPLRVRQKWDTLTKEFVYFETVTDSHMVLLPHIQNERNKKKKKKKKVSYFQRRHEQARKKEGEGRGQN